MPKTFQRTTRCRLIILPCLCVGMLSVLCAFSQQESAAMKFYRSLGAGISSVKGTVFLDLSQGDWNIRQPGGPVRIRVDEGTVARLTFDYNGGFLCSARVNFTPPIHVWAIRRGPNFSVGIDTLKYDTRGSIVGWNAWSDNERARSPGPSIDLKKALEFSRYPKDLLNARPFEFSGSLRKVDGQGREDSRNRPMVSRIRFLKTGEDNPGLEVSLLDRASIYFSQGTGTHVFSNFVTVSAGSGFEFGQIDYDVEAGSLKGRLERLRLSVRKGIFNSRDIHLDLRLGSTVFLNQVEFQRNADGTALVDAEFGTLEAQLSAGSYIMLAGNVPNPSTLLFDDSTDVNLQGFGFEISEGKRTRIMIGGGSEIRANLRGGCLGFGKDGFLSISSGRIHADLSGNWSSSSQPDATLGISHLDISLDGGRVPLNGDSENLKIASGTIRSTGLSFEGLAFAGLTGSLTDFKLTFLEGSRFGVPGGFQLVTRPGASISKAEGDPLRLEKGAKYPLGSYNIDFPFHHFSSFKGGNSFGLHDGELEMELTQTENGGLSGKEGLLRGMLTLRTGDASLASELILDRGVLGPALGGERRFSGIARLKVNPTLTLEVETPFINGYTDEKGDAHNDFRVFPLKLRASMLKGFTSNEVRLSLSGRGISLSDSWKGTVPFTLVVPAGGGEHKNYDDPNSADGTAGPDEYKQWQEAVRDKFGLWTAHLYLKPQSYNVNSDLHIGIEQNQVVVGVSKFQTSEKIAWEKDGCELNLLLPIGGFLFGCLFGSGELGGIVGIKAGHDLDSQIRARIDAGIAAKILGLKKEWSIALPPLDPKFAASEH